MLRGTWKFIKAAGGAAAKVMTVTPRGIKRGVAERFDNVIPTARDWNVLHKANTSNFAKNRLEADWTRFAKSLAGAEVVEYAVPRALVRHEDIRKFESYLQSISSGEGIEETRKLNRGNPIYTLHRELLSHGVGGIEVKEDKRSNQASLVIKIPLCADKEEFTRRVATAIRTLGIEHQESVEEAVRRLWKPPKASFPEVEDQVNTVQDRDTTPDKSLEERRGSTASISTQTDNEISTKIGNDVSLQTEAEESTRSSSSVGVQTVADASTQTESEVSVQTESYISLQTEADAVSRAGSDVSLQTEAEEPTRSNNSVDLQADADVSDKENTPPNVMPMSGKEQKSTTYEEGDNEKVEASDRGPIVGQSAVRGLSNLQKKVISLVQPSISAKGKAANFQQVWQSKGMFLRPVGTQDKQAVIESASQMLNAMCYRECEVGECVTQEEIETVKAVAVQLQSSGAMELTEEQKALVSPSLVEHLEKLIDACQDKISALESEGQSQDSAFIYQRLMDGAEKLKSSVAFIPGLASHCGLAPLPSPTKPLLSGVPLDAATGLLLGASISDASGVPSTPDPTPSLGAAANACKAK